jgi:hypothetical protein
MIDFFKKRSTATVIAVILMAVFLLVGVRRSLGSAADKVSESFYSGVYDTTEKYTRPGIGDLLDERINASLGLISLASGYDLTDEADALRTSRESLMSAESLHDKYEANEKLTADFDALYTALDGQSLSENDRSAAEDYNSVMVSTAALIESSGYNEAVESFVSGTLKKFPTVILWRLAGVSKPEMFN